MLPACVCCPQARDPRQTGEVDPYASYGITATMEHQEQAEHGHHRRHMMFCAGQAVERDTLAAVARLSAEPDT